MSSRYPAREELTDHNRWPVFTPEIWGWYWSGRQWKPIYAHSSNFRAYSTGSYTAPTIHPVKLRQRMVLGQHIQRRGGTVIEVYAGRGNLSSKVYASRGRRLVLLDSDAKSLQQAHGKLKGRVVHETVCMDNVKWMNQEMNPRDYPDVVLVDFDAFGCPAEPAKAFFNNYPVKRPMYVAFTDGSSLHNRYIQDDEGRKWLRSTYGVNRIPDSSRAGTIGTLDQFMEVEGRKHGFSAEKISVGHGDANTVYAGYRITPTRRR